MFISGLFMLLLYIQKDIPYKAKEEFEIKLDYQFKRRESEKNVTKSMLPYVVLKLKLLKLNNEEKLKVETNMRSNFLVRKHIEPGKEYILDLGFTSDIKDEISANEYTVLLLSTAKQPISKIIILVESNGTFKVNGETRGKF